MKPCLALGPKSRLGVRHSITVLAVASGLLVSACGGDGGAAGDGVVCTTEVRTSVLITVVDATAAPIPSAVVSYQINGGPAQSLVCPAAWACPVGLEQAGSFSLTVGKLGFVTVAATVQVNRDVCHVQTEQLRVVLRAAG